MPAETTGLEIRGAASGLLDDPLLLSARGAGSAGAALWHARFRDDDDRVWRATAARADELPAAWTPAKASTGALAALQSLRPVRIEVRVEADDGRAATRTLVRRLLGEGVRVRRWRDVGGAVLHLPADPAPCAVALIDATAGPRDAVDAATLAAPLLASRGALTLVVPPPSADGMAAAEVLERAAVRLAAMGAAAGLEVRTLPGVVLPPGVAARGGSTDADARATAWDALLAELGARPRADA